MDENVFKIGLAGLMHDIGKFVQNGMDMSEEYRTNNADLYQPFYDGRHTHQHALYTAAFIEHQADLLPDKLNAAAWAESDSFINLAAGHHRPDSPLQHIVSQADRISSGQDRASFEEGEAIGFREYRKTRLLPLFEQIDLESSSPLESRDRFFWQYPLRPVSAESIFPEQIKRDLSAKDAREEYRVLYEKFMFQLSQLRNREDSLELWAQHFDSLLHSFTAHVPAARVGTVVPDVSLYDHAKTTAALAAALYLYHRDTKTLRMEEIQNEQEAKFLLVSGDFYGIQEFIFSAGGDTKALRSKLLRGRSFAVSILSELAADMLCRELELPVFSVVLNTAGKFTVLAPNTEAVREGVERVRQEINEWLFAISYGGSSFGLTATVATQREFVATQKESHSRTFGNLWTRHKTEMEASKACKLDLAEFGGAVDDYLDSFDNSLEPSLCPFCGVRPSQIGAFRDIYLGESGSSCKVCRDHIMMGTMLVKGTRVVVLSGEAEEVQKDKLLEPLFGKYQVLFKNDDELEKISVGDVVRVWNTDIAKDGAAVSPVTNRFINGYVPVYHESDLLDDRLVDEKRREEDLENVRQGVKAGRPKTFSDIAQLALNVSGDVSGKLLGTGALSVLKADVDNLGLLMGCGLPEERYTISRLATLSRQLDSFFSIYLPWLLQNEERFAAVYTVFAGGDDLFLIGPWNRMVELAMYLREKFAEFVCRNDQLHFSAGITMSKPHAPVDNLADRAEHALEKAKDVDGKNSITIFDETVTWEQLASLVECGKQLESWCEKYVSRSVFYRFNELVDMAAQEKVLDREEVHIADMQCLRWKSQLNYQLVRNLNAGLKGRDREEALDEMKVLGQWLQEYGGAMKIPLWSILYNQR